MYKIEEHIDSVREVGASSITSNLQASFCLSVISLLVLA